MERISNYRTALDAVFFLLKGLPDDFLSDSEKDLLKRIVSDLLDSIRKCYE